MPKTPEQNDLQFVQKEISGLQNLLSPHLDTKVMENPTREAVLSKLREHQIVHLSCHGRSEADPSQSSFLLNDWKTAPLTVSDITSLKTVGQFAYLSACHTSTSYDIRLLDESISLSSAIQLSGYPSVVGSLWSVTDNHSAEIATDVYARMLDGSHLNTQRSAEALHWAVRALRERSCIEPGFTRKSTSDVLVWAPYIHIGI